MAMIALDIALLVAAAFDAVGCEYFLGGSVASSLQGEPRATNDIDFVVAMPRFRVRAFAEKLGSDFEIDQDMLRDALDRGGCANIFYLPAVTKVDIFGLGNAPYDEAEFGRRRRMRVRSTGEELFVKSPEDTVLRKLLWYREGGETSEKQWRDVVEVLRVSGPEMNLAYLDTWTHGSAWMPCWRARGRAWDMGRGDGSWMLHGEASTGVPRRRESHRPAPRRPGAGRAPP